MKKRNKLSAILAVLLLIISIFAVAQLPIPVSASPGSVEVSLPTYSYTYPEKKPGDGLVMELRIENLTDPPDEVVSWEANFTYDDTILDYVNMTKGGFLNQSGPIDIDYGTETTPGEVTGINITLTQAGDNSTGSGILAYLTFMIVGMGSTTIDLDVKVLNSTWSEITVITVDGYFELGVEVSLPTYSYTYPEKKLGDGLVMELRIEAPESADWNVGIYTWQANFTFDPTILQYVNLTKGGYLNQSGQIDIDYGSVNNTVGTVTGINITLTQAGDNSTGSGILAYLTFMIVGMGSTTIDLDVKVLDLQDHDLPITTVDGNFALGTLFKLPSVSWVYGGSNIGDTFEMNLTVDTAELHGWQAGFTWDPSVLNCTGITEGPFLSSVNTTDWYEGDINNETGVATPFGAALRGNYSASGFDGVLATIGFQVVGAGSTDIELVNSTAMDPEGNSIPVTTVDGYFELGAIMELGSSVIWRYPTNNIGDEFSMDLTIKTPELYAWQTGLSFDPTVVNVINITGGLGFFLNQSGPIEWYYDDLFINNTAGTVDTFGCTILGDHIAPETGPDGAVIATIWFNATGAGSTTIELTDTKAFSSEIPVTTVDGYFELGITFTLPFIYWYYLGQTFVMNLTVDTPELHGWQAGFTWDPSVLEVVSVTGGEGYFLNQSGPVRWVPGTWNNTTGTATAYGCTFLGANEASGTGVLMSITFNVIGYGKTFINITDSMAIDLDGHDIPLTLVDGHYTTMPPEGVRIEHPVDWNQDNVTDFYVETESNSTISNFAFDLENKQISFNVTGPDLTTGFCNVTIPKNLLEGEPWLVLLDETTELTPIVTTNDTHTFLYVTYPHGTHMIQIIGTWVIPEFSTSTLLMTLLIIALTIAFLAKRTWSNKRRHL